jgi:hypothetical protein
MPTGSARGKLDGHLQGFLVGRKRLVRPRWAGRQSCAQWATLDEAADRNALSVLGGKADISIRAQASANDPKATCGKLELGGHGDIDRAAKADIGAAQGFFFLRSRYGPSRSQQGFWSKLP